MTPSPLEQIRVLIVDDEKPARQRLIELLRNDSQVGDIPAAENGIAAVDTIPRNANERIGETQATIRWSFVAGGAFRPQWRQWLAPES